ncbi:MAG: AMP-binding protein [Okeania sp. SIO1H6]|nr:AMP-binding protein [Okeania sp. SIO1H6]
MRKIAPECKIINHYGPTEATVGTTTFAVDTTANRDDSATVPIGKAIANTQIYLLNSEKKPVPMGVAGELYIGGAGLARGYLNQPQLTAEKFIVNPFAEKGRLYRTGDLARYLSDGNIEFIGRTDYQVKIRGFRIELGEIESVLSSHPQIQQAIVIATGEIPTKKRLVAYIVTSNGAIATNELRKCLLSKLPDYMIPSAFVNLEAFPLTPNGKVDRKALPAPEVEVTPEQEYVAPRTANEEIIANIFASVIDIQAVGIHNNFFDLGGHSLLATQLISRVRQTFGITIPLNSLFESPTVAQLTNTVEDVLQKGVYNQEEIDFDAEAILEPSIIPQTIVGNNIIKHHNILLTGVTGFVGADLLIRLLQKTSANVYCLIRATDADSAKQKLQRKLESYLLWDETFSSRIIPVVGDFSSKFFGLSTDKFKHLANQIDVIYHSGAFVNHIYPYTALKTTNVLGTQEVLKLASENHVKPVHFISTLGVLSLSSNYENGIILESDFLTDTPKNKSGYQQSKWVAEKLVMAARERGLPTSIYRLPMITANTQTGASNINDRVCRMITACLQLGMIPILENEAVDNWIPVNEINQAIVHLSQQQECLGKAFHLLNPQPISINNVFNWLYSLDYSLKKVSLNDWITKLSATPENPLYPYILQLELMNKKSDKEQSDKYLRTIDDKNTKNGLVDSNITFTNIDEKYLETMLSFLIESGVCKTQ